MSRSADHVTAGQTPAVRVGVAGFEPTASSSRTKRATKLRHTPLEASTAYRTRPSTGQTAAAGHQFQAQERSNSTSASAGSVGIKPLGADPLVAEVGVGVAVAAVGEQRDHRTAAAVGDHLGEQPERAPQVGARRRPHAASQHGADMAGGGDGRRVGHRRPCGRPRRAETTAQPVAGRCPRCATTWA